MVFFLNSVNSDAYADTRCKYTLTYLSVTSHFEYRVQDFSTHQNQGNLFLSTISLAQWILQLSSLFQVVSAINQGPNMDINACFQKPNFKIPLFLLPWLRCLNPLALRCIFYRYLCGEQALFSID